MHNGQVITVGHGVSVVLPVFDFETYSEAGFLWDGLQQKWISPPGISSQKRGLPGVGVYNYVDHPTFEVLCLAYDLFDGLGARFWRPGMPAPQDLLDHVVRGDLISAFNVGFERAVWNRYCVRAFGWPPLRDEQLRCDMAKARAWSTPGSLGELGVALRLTQQKDAGGSKLIRELTVPRKPTAKNPDRRLYPHTAPEKFRQFYAYNVQDVLAEAEASSRIPDLCPRELEIWQVDQKINQRGMQIDLPAVGNCIAIAEQCSDKLNAELRTITHGAVQESSKAADMMRWFLTFGVHLENLDEDAVSEALTAKYPANVHRVLEIRRDLAFGSIKKLYAMRAQTSSDGRLRDQYAYHGAHTSLWNGQNVQVANLYKGKLDKPDKVEHALSVIASGSLDYVENTYGGSALEVIADCLRSMIVAAPGHRLISSDYRAIQAVVTAALAGEEWRMEVFRTHGKIYEMCAAKITGKPFQFYIDYKKQHDKHHEDRQPFGKIPELASGFGGWIPAWVKFGALEFMTEEEIKKAILAWRRESPMIVELWGGQTRNRFGRDLNGNRALEGPELYGLEGAAVSAVLHPGKCFAYRGIRYMTHGDVLYCQPPGDGAPLCYHEPRLIPSRKDWARAWESDLSYMGYSKDKGWHREALYGGVLTQNVVAKVSREPQANALVACEKTGIYLPVMHTHDEIVTEVRDGAGNADEYLAIINNIPSWMADEHGRPWPVIAPGADETQRYGKWE